MPIPTTRQTNVDPFMGKMLTLNSDAQIDQLPFKVNTSTKTLDYTVKASESGTFFCNRGATAANTFTLPAVASGLNYHFYAAADFAVTVAPAAENTIVCDDNVAADALLISTGSEIMGGCIFVVCDGTKWVATGYLEESQTLVVTSA